MQIFWLGLVLLIACLLIVKIINHAYRSGTSDGARYARVENDPWWAWKQLREQAKGSLETEPFVVRRRGQCPLLFCDFELAPEGRR